MLTYRQLLQKLQQFNDEQLDSHVTICDIEEEYHAVVELNFADPTLCDVLDPGHPYLLI